MYPLPENIGRRMRTTNFVRFFCKYGPVDLLYFYRESEEPDIDLAGRQPTPEIKTLCDSVPNIELHPDFPDLKPFYQQSGVVVVPILTAGGTRIKILEAGIAGRPVLSTPMGAHGLDAIDGKDLFLFDDDNSFMGSYQKLQDKAVYDSMAGNMKSLVRNLYSPESFQRKMEEAIRPLM